LSVHRHPFDLHAVDGELLRDGGNDAPAQIDAEAHRLLGLVDERKRGRVTAVGNRHRLGALDPFQGAFGRLRVAKDGGNQ
jgi:hypothetical protein